jgi:hypothetical protein
MAYLTLNLHGVSKCSFAIHNRGSGRESDEELQN